MKINHQVSPFPHVLIEDVYTFNELNLIWRELDFLTDSHKLNTPDKVGAAKDLDTGQILKMNGSLWLEDVFKDPKYSDIVSTNKKIYDNFEIIFREHPDWFFQNVNINFEGTLISYYEDSDYYKPHEDNATVTCLTWFYKEPKKFNGGNLHFPHYNLTIKVKTNTAILFPSCITHAVDPVKMDRKDIGKKKGRYCMTQFLSILPYSYLNDVLGKNK